MTRFFVKHPVTTWMIFLAFVVLAVYSLPKIEVEAIPEVDLPSLSITTTWNGASPKAVQRSITLPIEEAVRGVRGAENLRSESRNGSSTVTVEMRRGINLDFARLEVNERLSSIRRNLPVGASQPVIQVFVPEELQTEQFFSFRIESELPPNELREQAEIWVAPQVMGVDGVADASVRGGADALIEIRLDRELLDQYGLTANQIMQTVLSLDDLAGAGVVRDGGFEQLVSVRDDVNVESLRQAAVARVGGRTFTLGMLAEIVPTHDDPQYFVRSNGLTTVQVLVEKRSGGNSVEVSRALRKALPRIEANLPFDAKLEVEEDEGKELEDQLKELLIRSLVILAVLFVLLAISLRQVVLTSIVIASIIFALVICLSLFYFLDLSVNFITISGLTICFGLLLDNSILVLDSVHRRLESLIRAEREGLSRAAKLRVVQEAVVQGTGDVTFPILATTLTTVVAFGSFLVFRGDDRLTLYYIPLAIAVGTAMLASIFVAFGWIPVVLGQTWAGRLVNRGSHGTKELESEEQLDEIVHILPDLEKPLSWPRRIVAFLQHIWPLTLAGLALLGWLTFQTWNEDVVKGGFFRFGSDEELVVFLRMPEGTDVTVTNEIIEKFEQSVLPLEEGATMRAQAFGNIGILRLEFTDELRRTPTPLYYRSLLVEQADVTGSAGVFIRGFSDQPYFKGRFGNVQTNSSIKVTGYNSKVLTEICDNVLRTVQRSRRVRTPLVTTVQQFRRSTTEETVIQLKRDVLADYGLSVTDVVFRITRLLGVDIPRRMMVDGEQELVEIAYADAEEIEFSDLTSYVLDTPRGEQVRIGDLIEVATLPVSDSVTRENQRYSMYVSWEYVGTDKMRQAYLRSILDSMDLPYGYNAETSEREFFTDDEEEGLHSMVRWAAIFIFLVLAALFESLFLPLLVLLSLGMGLIGVVHLYAWSNASFDSSAWIGLVLLFGVVVNNGILLVSRYRREAALTLAAKLGGDPEANAGILKGTRSQFGGSDLYVLDPKERGGLLRRAVARGTMTRLRSILLTSGTTVVGLLPLLVSIDHVPSTLMGIDLPVTIEWMNSENQNIWENLALTSVGGMVSSTILLLIAMPGLYYGVIRCWWVLRRLYDATRARIRRTPPVVAPPSPDPPTMDS